MRQTLSISKLASAILAVSVIQNIYAFTFTNPDPRYPEQYAINNLKDTDMNVLEGWDYYSPSTNEVVVALLDTGIDTTHPDLIKSLWKNPGEVDANGKCFTDKGDHDGNGYENDCYGYNALTKTGINDGIKDANGVIVPPNQGKGNDPWGHGTQMAGTIAATANNGIGVVGMAGIAKNVKIVTCAAWDRTRTIAQLSTYPITDSKLNPVAGLPADQVSCGKYFIDLKKGNAEKGIKPVNIAVLNSSGGASHNIAAIPGISGVAKPEFWININTPGVKDMIDALKLHDILLVTSAGNYNWDLDNQIENLISVENKAYYPASFNVDNILTVGATNSSGNFWSIHPALGSSWGRFSVDVSAPGDTVLTTDPLYLSSADPYVGSTGSSPSAGYVSGMAALIKANNATSHLSAQEVRRLIISSGKNLDALKHTTSSGKLVRLDGALNCVGKAFKRRQFPKTDSVTIGAGGQLVMEVQNYNCASASSQPYMNVVDLLTNIIQFKLRDDGVGVDKVAGDGVFSGSWNVPSSSIYQLSFGIDSVTGKADVVSVNPKTTIVDAGPGGTKTGTWQIGLMSVPFRGISYWANNQTTPSSYTFSFTAPKAGSYKLYANWPIDKTASTFRDKAQYVISTTTGNKVVERNQQKNGGAWAELGLFQLNAGTNTVVVKNSQHTDIATDIEPVIGQGNLIIDSLRIDQYRN